MPHSQLFASCLLLRPSNVHGSLSPSRSRKRYVDVDVTGSVSAQYSLWRRRCRQREYHVFQNQCQERSFQRMRDLINKASWKPAILRLLQFTSVSKLTASCIDILEFLSQKSRTNGGVAFTGSQFPTSISLGYLYLPTVIAVLYSILWSWIDLDTTRLEPWFHFSRPGDAWAIDSLLLLYPFDFLA